MAALLVRDAGRADRVDTTFWQRILDGSPRGDGDRERDDEDGGDGPRGGGDPAV